VIALPIAIVAVLLANVQNLPFAQDALAWLRGIGGEWWALPVFFALYIVCALFLLPVTPLSAAAALAWGWGIGGTLDLVACTIAALPPFYLAQRRLPARVRAYLDQLRLTPDFFPLLILRVVPIVPYVALNYLAGLARFRVRDYTAATFVGSIPSCFLFAFFIDTLGDSAMGAATQLRIVGACAAIALLLIIGRWGAKYASRIARPTDGGDPRSAAPEPPPE
jgi:uncharacterized membrane protein YdjX (TVP38/TMEM64 family)